MIETIAGLTLPQWAAVFSIGGVIVSMFKPVRVRIRRAWEKTFGKTNAMLTKHIEDEDTALARIEKELKPNGQTSLRDAVDRVEEHLKSQDAFLRATLNIHDVAIVRTDAKGKLTDCNRAYMHLMKVGFNEVQGDGWVNIIDPSNREDVVRKWQSAVAGYREFNEDILFRSTDGIVFKAHANVFREVDLEGRVLGYLGVIVPYSQEASIT